MIAASATLGERVRAARKELGLSQAQLAGEDLTKGFISQLESGLVRPSVRSLQLIASRLSKPLDYFLGDAPLAAGKRVAFHRLAAETAAERQDWTRVREHVERALAEAPEGRDRATLLHLLGRATVASRDFEGTFELVAKAMDLVRAESEPQLVAELLYLRGYAYGEQGQLAAATEVYEAARDVVERFEITDPRLRSKILVALGTMYRRLKRPSKALASYQAALATASRSSELMLAARGYMGIAASHYDSGELDAAISNYSRALDISRRVSDIDFELRALQSIALVQFENDDDAAAKVTAEHAMQRALEVGALDRAAVVEITFARIALRAGRAADALGIAKHAEGVLDRAEDRMQQADALSVIAAAHEALGQRAEADRAYRTSLDMYASIGNLVERSARAAEYARSLKARGDLEAAYAMLEVARGGAAPR
ncbi:MAG: tetratricopeptide repeat protein [Chloroflexi bacterium]|nr:tetratricopeptide repeat protein [Chloroflexota bacterium]